MEFSGYYLDEVNSGIGPWTEIWSSFVVTAEVFGGCLPRCLAGVVRRGLVLLDPFGVETAPADCKHPAPPKLMFTIHV